MRKKDSHSNAPHIAVKRPLYMKYMKDKIGCATLAMKTFDVRPFTPVLRVSRSKVVTVEASPIPRSQIVCQSPLYLDTMETKPKVRRPAITRRIKMYLAS